MGAEKWLEAAKVRKLCGNVSAVTFWRWRNDPDLGFPAGRLIRGRWYFPVNAVRTWWTRRPQRREEPKTAGKDLRLGYGVRLERIEARLTAVEVKLAVLEKLLAR